MPPATRRTPAADLTASSDATDALPRLDGRRTHIVDRALDYAQLAEQGMSAARIARKRRRSEGYVSIALRLGRAIRGMEPGELAALRSPRITWKLAQRIVREDADPLAIRHQLRSALGGFSTHNVDGRKLRKRRRGATGSERPVGAAWGWDAAWFARDPVGFVDAHLRYLANVQRAVQDRASRAVGTRAVDRVPVGQGIRSLQRSLARAATDGALTGRRAEPAGPPSAERRALAALEIIARKLAEARADAAEPLTPAPSAGAEVAAGPQAAGSGAAPTGRASSSGAGRPHEAPSNQIPGGVRWTDALDELDD